MAGWPTVDWPTWHQAAIAAVVLLAVFALTRPLNGRWARLAAALAGEMALISVLYVIWQIAAGLPLQHNGGAVERGKQIFRFEHAVHLPSELAVERWVAPHRLLSEACNVYYATLHVPVLLLFLLWLFIRHRDQYPRWRNSLAILTAFCLFVRFVRVAPPRLLPGLGFFDLGARYGQSVYGPVGTGISDQYAAMPSIHVGWAAVVGIGIVCASRSRWRWVALFHPALTLFVVGATGNHWWMDGIVAIGLLGLSLAIDQAARALLANVRRRRRSQTTQPLPVGSADAERLGPEGHERRPPLHPDDQRRPVGLGGGEHAGVAANDHGT